MAIVTSQQIQNYYDNFLNIDVTFTKDVVRSLNFVTEAIFIKILGQQWPCVIHSTSFTQAKIIISIKAEQMERLRSSSGMIALRFSFKRSDKTENLTFFINGKIKGFNRYNSNNQDLYFMTMDFTQRPPDDLIEILGQFLELHVNSKQRKELRIPINETVIKKIGFVGTSTVIAVDGIDRKCLIRDLSFGGAKVLIPGIAKFLLNKSVIFRINTPDSSKSMEIPGQFVRVEEVAERKDITVAAIQYKEESIPLEYKHKINDFLKVFSKQLEASQAQAKTIPPTKTGTA